MRGLLYTEADLRGEEVGQPFEIASGWGRIRHRRIRQSRQRLPPAGELFQPVLALGTTRHMRLDCRLFRFGEFVGEETIQFGAGRARLGHVTPLSKY